MLRLVLLATFALGACAVVPNASAPSPREVRPVVVADELQGRWTIVAVNDRPVGGLWLELGREGLGTITQSGTGIFVAAPQPPTRAHLGCNDWHPNGWTRNGDKLTFGMEMSRRTERGCDAARTELDREAYVILSKTTTMELGPPDRLRLINENGALDLVRQARN